LISQSQVEQVVETLVNSYERNGKTADRETLQTLVDQLIKSTINGWVSSNLEAIVSEAVEREIAKSIEDKRYTG
jgi:cell pole-organizing protein PopZ